MVVLTLAIGAAATSCILWLAPRAVATVISRALRKSMAEGKPKMKKSFKTGLATMASLDNELASGVWARKSRVKLHQVYVAVFTRALFVEGCRAMAGNISKDEQLKETIRKGVLQALRDEDLQASMKMFITQSSRDPELQSATSKAANNSVKMGIIEAMQDPEFKGVIAEAIKDAVEDPHFKQVLLTAARGALADQELHAATMKGAARALNPLQNIEIPIPVALPDGLPLPRRLAFRPGSSDGNASHQNSAGSLPATPELGSPNAPSPEQHAPSSAWRRMSAASSLVRPRILDPPFYAPLPTSCGGAALHQQCLLAADDSQLTLEIRPPPQSWSGDRPQPQTPATSQRRSASAEHSSSRDRVVVRL